MNNITTVIMHYNTCTELIITVSVKRLQNNNLLLLQYQRTQDIDKFQWTLHAQ